MHYLRWFRAAALCVPFLSVLLSTYALAQTVRDGFEDVQVASVVAPSALAVVGDGRLLIASQYGQVYVYEGGTLLETPALDLTDRVCAYRERGLVGLAVDPEFAANHFIYVTYTFNKFGNCEAEDTDTPVGRVSRFVLHDDNTVDAATERILIDNVPSPIGAHNLDDVEFGRDGLLYVSVGDGACDFRGDSGCFDTNNAAQDRGLLNGKILRITRDGEIPDGNPFTGADSTRCNVNGHADPGLICQEIFVYGLRNPWRMAFDPNAAGTRFFINDVGQDTWEEIDEAVAGANYGWNIREGFCANGSTTDCSPVAPPDLTNPIYAYDRAEGCASITGGAFVPNGAWPSEFDGTYIFSDYVCGAIFVLARGSDGSYTRESFAAGLGNSSAVDLVFGPHDGGVALYYTSYAGSGEVRRIAYVGTSNRKPLAVATATPAFGAAPLTVTFDGTSSSDPDGDELTYSWDFGDGSPAVGGSTAVHEYPSNGVYTASLQVTDAGGASGSATVRIEVGNSPPQPAIQSPAADDLFAVGDTIVLQGSATDPEDGTVADASLTWRVILHHNTHTHGFLPPTQGNGITFRAPGPENLEAALTSYLEVQLTATDSAGSQTTVTQALRPRTARLDFLTDPPGLHLTIDNADVVTPASFVSWVNFGVMVDAPSQSGPGGTPLAFTSWSDGGAASHVVVTPESNASYTAHFSAAASVSVPGVIEAENFDNGGAGISYSDTTPGNSGGQYRPTDVDIEATADSGGGYDVGWAFAGEWLAYTVNVGSAGTYDIAVRVASNGSGGIFHIEASDVDKTGPMIVPDTGGWQTWTTVHKTGVPLNAGPQVWRLVMDSNGSTTAVGNFNFVSVAPADGGSGGSSTPFGGSAVALPGLVQAENFDEGGEGVAYHDLSSGNSGGEQYRPTDVDVEGTSDGGGGFDVGWAFAGEWLNYSVTVGSAGRYNVSIRVASGGAGGTFHLEVNGVDKTGPISVPDTGGWQAWTTLTRAGVGLAAGPQVWRLVMDGNGSTTAVANFNFIEVTAAASDPAASIVRQPYLQQVTDSSAVVVWTTRLSGAGSVQYTAAGGSPVTVAATSRLFTMAQTGLTFDYYQHEARLVGLAPAASYGYDVLMNGQDATPGQDSFRTAPAMGTGSIRFIAFGDSGVGSTAQRTLSSNMSADSFDLALHVGDVAYGNEALEGGGSYQQYEDWAFAIYAPWLRTRPLFPSIGNHDDETADALPYREVFVLPENGASAAYPDNAERYYSFDYGPVHFVALDTETAFRDDPGRQAAQLAWLEQDLAATSQPWRVAFFHRSPYSASGGHGSDLEVREKFSPLLEHHGVRLVLTGHDHNYERTVPLREFTGSGPGITYVVTGGGGAALYPSGSDYWTAASSSAYHYTRVSVDGCTLRVEAVRIDGVVFDQFAIDRCTPAP